ncbi:MAG: SpoIIE family protein phosphatase [Bacteroidales bacterium]|nr:SpoIIE family protein phosphatase [Bacteroidales bacterium]
MFKIKNYFILIFFVILTLNLKPQQNNFRVFSIEEGLPQSTIFKITQDKRGYLWLGTNGGGVCRFDGLNFVTFSKKKGLSGNIVRTIYEDSNGKLWIGTEEGITIFDGFRFKIISNDDGLSGNNVLCFYEDVDKNIWAGTSDGGLNIISMTNNLLEIKTLTKNDGLISNFIFDIIQDNHDRIWVGMLGGINILNVRDSIHNIQYLMKGINIPSNIIVSLEIDSEGNLWCGSYYDGLFKIENFQSNDSAKVIQYENIDAISNQVIWDILYDKNGDLWVATDKSGVIKIENKYLNSIKNENIIEYNNTHGLPDNQILNIYEDIEGNIWFGTNGSGLCQFLGDYFTHYTINEGLSSNQVFGISQDNSGNYWLATYGGGLLKMSIKNNKPSFQIFQKNTGLPDNFILSLTFTPDNKLWLATANKGICKYQDLKWILYNENQGLINNKVNCIYSDSKGNIWCGTAGGISKFDGKRFVNISEYDGLINNEVQTIIEDTKGNIWFGTLGGLAWTNERLMTDYDETDGLTEKRVKSLAEDNEGNIWIGTFGGGLFKFIYNADSMPVKFIADDQVLSSNNIYSLLFQNDSVLIIGTDKGFDKVLLNENKQIKFVKNYDKSEGFIGIENNLNAIYKDKDNNIWFGTVKGLTRYDSKKEKANLNPPQTHITDLRLFFENIDWGERVDSVRPWFRIPASLKLPHSKNHLTFKFSGISLKNPYKIQYSYKLEGLDENWSPPSPKKEASYPGLPPGDYIFKVKAGNENNIWNSEPIEFIFIINPPFWKRWWFYLSIIIIITIVIIAYIKYRERQLRIENRILEEKVKERTARIEKQKVEIEEKNKYILDSIAYAKRIQDAVMPSKEVLDKVLNEYFILFKPRDIVSGDFYWVTQKENKIVIAVADCTGHGVPGAFMSMLGVAFLNEIVNKSKVSTANEILNQLRDNVKQTLSQSGKDQEARDGMDLALCIFDNETKTCQYSGAYNPLVIFKNGELIEMKADKMPIGIHITEKDTFTNHEIKFKKGDIFYMFSDGFLDQFGGDTGRKFMAKPFKNLLSEIHAKPMHEQKAILNRTLENWQGNQNQVDDILIIGIRI